MHYLYLNAWFVEAERIRSQGKSDYGLVGSALSQNTFIIVMRLMKECGEKGEHYNIDTVFTSMLFFKQILLAVNDLEKHESDAAKEMADNMKTRLFYEEYSLDVIAQLPRTASRYSNAYLKECIELCHIVLKTLDAYSKQHTVLFVRSKRQRRKKKRETQQDEYGDSENEEQESARVTTERKFEFSKFETRFIHESTIDSYIRFLSNYRELTSREIKWAISFFHRCFVKREARSVFFRLDLMRLFQMMTSSSSGLSHSNEVRRDVERFMEYYVGKLRAALDKTPSLFVELLFNKIPESIFYLDHGYDRPKNQKVARNEWEFKDPSIAEEHKFAIVVAALVDEDKNSMIEWAITKVGEVREKRISWIHMNVALRLSDEDPHEFHDEALVIEGDEQTYLMDGKFQLLLKLIGFTIGRDNRSMVLPYSVTQQALADSEKYMKRYLFESVDFGGTVAVDHLKRKGELAYRSESEDDPIPGEMEGFLENNTDHESDGNDDGFRDTRFDALPEDERLAKKLSMMKKRPNAEKKTSKRASKRSKIDASGREARRKQRELEEAEKRKKIKSSAFVYDSDTDEERDREFFEKERLLRERMANGGLSQLSIDKSITKAVPVISPEPSSVPADSGDYSSSPAKCPASSLYMHEEILDEEPSLFETDDEMEKPSTQLSRPRKRNVVLSDDEDYVYHHYINI